MRCVLYSPNPPLRQYRAYGWRLRLVRAELVPESHRISEASTLNRVPPIAGSATHLRHFRLTPGRAAPPTGRLGTVNDVMRAERDATASPTAIVLASIGLMLIAVGLIFGSRDAWVSARGLNGSIAGGLTAGLITLIPIASVGLSVAISRRQARGRSSTLLRAGVVAVVVGLPVALFLVIAAAY